MPELPDVQVFKEYLDATALHERIDHVHIAARDVLDDVSASTLRRHLEGRSFDSTRRHGKNLFVDIERDDAWLRLHFGMTGNLKYYKDDDKEPDHTRLRADFSNGYHLAYRNTRKLGQIGLVKDVDEYIEERGLGPDALASDFDLRAFREVLEGRRGTIKGALMNQSAIAGIGNVYADEILFHAGVHPEAKVNGLDDDSVAEIFYAMKKVLEKAIEARVENFPRNFLVPRREEGADCPRCDGQITKTRVSGRPTYFCPDHQSVRR
jgi:formamidopyrimidine-DNA glycosylase